MVSSAPGLRLDVTARPGRVRSSSLRPGTSNVPLTSGRQGLLRVPSGEISGLVVALHGAGGQAQAALDLFDGPAERLGLVVFAPSSIGSTWAPLHGGTDPDTPALDAALATVFRSHAFDPAAVAVAGFSDGASYALSLGLANGDLFGKVVAFSPGFQFAERRRGRPRFFVTHGVGDQVLPIGRTSRRLVPSLRREGYQVSYQEFEGGHVIPDRYRDEAAGWLLGGGE